MQVDITSSEALSSAFETVKGDIVVHNAGVPNLAERFRRRLEQEASAEALVLKASSSKMVTCALRPSVLSVPGGYHFNLWDITHVDNAADAHVLAIEDLLPSCTAAGEAFFFQNNEPIVSRDLCLAIWAHFGHVPPFEMRIPERLAYFSGLACETVTWLMRTTTLSRGIVQDTCATRYASGNKAKENLGYEARIGIKEAIRLSCENYTSHLRVKSPILNGRSRQKQ
ncbi:hypothetical protein N7516_004783 [Penicillium verrucosum]|uniref:uncharacterized protein n=1 Tax=Penicillium verrucosum TaxID=60171 RepID=UPI0025458568|nr:uncharacterized protein N7516_004783 [Penicillium verrucosum]KAJ5944615.1 hypothetical protein N7516_004783 [Penicillium verrucosum]